MLVVFVILLPLLLLVVTVVALHWGEQEQFNQVDSGKRLDQETLMQKKKKQHGVTIVEYAIMLALVAIAIAVAAPNITSAVNGVFNRSSSVMNK
jgi:Flp pilus assembly pilin Flp